MGSVTGSDPFSGKRRREELHQFLPSAGEGTTSKRRKPESTGNAMRLEQRERAAGPSSRRQASAAPAEENLEAKYGPAASKMMAKMGFRPGLGLGKDGQGMVEPLEGVSRPAHAGLGSVEEPRPFIHGKEILPPPAMTAATPAGDELERPRWSRKPGAARKGPVLTKNALLATRAEEEQDEQAPMVVQKVIDMRGSQPRVLTDSQPRVRYKLSTSVLRKWQAHDASAYAALSPWKGVFDPASWEAMIARYVIPKLKLALKELRISPAIDCQELHQFNDRVMIWASVIPAQHMLHLLVADFFGIWLWVLYGWLRSRDPDFNEVVEWYKSWTGIFPTELLANERVRMLLAAGLVMMNNAAEGREVLPPGEREAVGCPKAEEDQQFDAARQAWQQLPMEDLSFKNCILAYAEEQGLKFMPRDGKFCNGVPVYVFGCVRVCVDSVKRLLYAQVPGAWNAVTLAQLMEMNRMARAC